MDKKYRIKLMKNQSNKDLKTLIHSRPKYRNLNVGGNVDGQHAKSHIVLKFNKSKTPQKQQNKTKIVNNPFVRPFSKVHKLFHSPQRQNRSRSKTVPQNSLSNKLINTSQLLNHSALYSKQQLSQSSQKIPKLPAYITKSNQMITTKQKILQLKHNIKLKRGDNPDLKSIEDKINDNRLDFSRKMKIQLCKNGNSNLLEYLQRNFNPQEYQQQKSQSKSKSKSKEKQYKHRDLENLLRLRNSDIKTNFESINSNSYVKTNESYQKIDHIKKKLKKNRRPILRNYH